MLREKSGGQSRPEKLFLSKQQREKKLNQKTAADSSHEQLNKNKKKQKSKKLNIHMTTVKKKSKFSLLFVIGINSQEREKKNRQ